MAKLRPELVDKMAEPAILNRATYACAAVLMDRYDWPGMADIGVTGGSQAEAAPSAE